MAGSSSISSADLFEDPKKQTGKTGFDSLHVQINDLVFEPNSESDSCWVCLPQAGSSYRLTNMIPSAPDMSQLKLGVRSVAGKLSVMASGVVNTIQVRPPNGTPPKIFQITNDLF